ncbi:MAG: DHH family phosphoesterase [Elusimicrobiota bacterium]
MKLIVTHKGADFDGLASLVAAGVLNPDFTLYLPGSPEKKVREYMEKEELPAKLSRYRDIRYKNLEELIVVDTGYLKRLGKVKDLIREDTRVYIYDHHPKTEMDIEAHRTVHKSWGATVTIFLEEMMKKNIEITPRQATLFMLGVYEDTGCLTYPLTSAHDLEAVSYLLKQGASLNKVSEYAIHHMDEEQVHLLSELLNNKVFISLEPEKILFTWTRLDNYVEELSVVVGKIMDILNPAALFAILEIREQIICIARSSSDDIDVGKVVSRLGGGGHMSAASVKFNSRDKSIVELKSDIREILLNRKKDIINEGYTRIIPSNHSVKRAYQTLNHLNLRYAPVGDKEGNIYGLVLREELAKALKHDMGDHLVDEFITEKVSVAGEKKLVDENFPPSYDTREYKINPVFKDISEKLDNQLSEDIKRLIKKISRVAENMGVNVYLVGGLVRDILMGNSHKDIDIIVGGDGIKFAKVLADKLGGSSYNHGKFKTSVVKTSTREIDVATLRREYYRVPAALPEVEKGDLRQDLYRRDFSINAMALQISPAEEYGKLIDYFGGLEDLSDKKIRILYPLSFVEDPTRIFRAIRFAQRFGFKLTAPTVKQLKKTVSMDIQERLTPDRIKDEIGLILNEPEPHKILKRLDQLGGLKCISEELKITGKVYRSIKKFNKKLKDLPPDLQQKVRKNKDKIMLLIILSSLSEKEGVRVLEQFNFSRKIINTFKMLKKYKKRISGIISRKLSRARIFKSLNFMPRRSLEYLLFVLENDKGKENVVKYLTEISLIEPKISGDDLIEMGFKPSPIFSRIIYALRIARINGKLTSLKDEKRYIKENYSHLKS